MAIAQDTPIFENSNHQERLGSKSIYNKAKVYRESHKESIKEYNKSYNEANKEIIKEYKKAYHEANKESEKAYRESNKEKKKEKDKSYYEANKEHFKAYRESHKDKIKDNNKAYREANKDKIKEREKAYREANKDKKIICHRNRRARKRNAEGSHTSADIQQLLTLQRKKCAVCHTSITKGYHVDHVIPLAMNGSNGKDNLQLLCAPCNLSKSAKHPIYFMQERGFLL